MRERSGFGLIPPVAWAAAAVVFVAVGGGLFLLFGNDAPEGLAIAIGAGMGSVLAAVILATGYVYEDAKRRGMPALPWAALALLAPNCLGFLLYFLLRKPMVRPCAGCGRGVPSDAAFCPACGQPQTTASVPQPGTAA